MHNVDSSTMDISKWSKVVGLRLVVVKAYGGKLPDAGLSH